MLRDFPLSLLLFPSNCVSGALVFTSLSSGDLRKEKGRKRESITCQQVIIACCCLSLSRCSIVPMNREAGLSLKDASARVAKERKKGKKQIALTLLTDERRKGAAERER